MNERDPNNPQSPKGWQARQIEYVQREDEMTGEKVVWDGNSWRQFHKINGVWEDKHVPKYYTMPLMERSQVLYNFQTALQNKEFVAVVEGPLDVLRTGSSVVGTIGKSVSMAQANMIKTNWDKAFIIRDPGVSETDPQFKRLLINLSGIPVVHLTLEGKKDPGSTPRESTWRQIAAAYDAKALGQRPPGNS